MSNLTVNKFLVNCFWPFASQSVMGATSFSFKTVPSGFTVLTRHLPPLGPLDASDTQVEQPPRGN